MISLLISLLVFLIIIYVLQLIANALKVPDDIQNVGRMILLVIGLLMVLGHLGVFGSEYAYHYY